MRTLQSVAKTGEVLKVENAKTTLQTTWAMKLTHKYEVFSTMKFPPHEAFFKMKVQRFSMSLGLHFRKEVT